MKKLLTLLTASFLAFSSTSLFAQNYYVCDTGDDNNNGTSESAPFRSYEKAISTFNKISAGDSVLFCRGGVFPITKRKAIFNTKCEASSVCTLADYGDSQQKRPHIISNGVTGIRFADGGKKIPDGGYAIKNLIVMSTTNQDVGVFLYNDVNDVTMDNLHIEGFKIGVQLADSLGDRNTLKNSVITKNMGQGYLGGCNDCLIENNNFENNGINGWHHNIYLSSHHVTVSNMIVRGNTLYKSAMDDGKCVGVSLVGHGRLDNLIIEDNFIKEDVGAVDGHCWGISINPGYTEEEVFRNVVIRNNKLLNVGNVGIGCGSCDGAIIENNTIIDEASVLVYGIAVPVLREDTVKSKNVIVRNNTIVLSKTWNQIAGIRARGVNPVTVQNNTIDLPDNRHGVCILTEDGSSNIDISSNTCKNHTSVSVIDKTIEEPTSTELASTASTSTELTSTEPTSTASTSTEPTSTASTSTEPTSTVSTSTEPTSTASTSTEPTTITKESKSSIKVVSLGSYKSSRGKPGGGVGFKTKCRAEAADGRCLLQ